MERGAGLKVAKGRVLTAPRDAPSASAFLSLSLSLIVSGLLPSRDVLVCSTIGLPPPFNPLYPPPITIPIIHSVWQSSPGTQATLFRRGISPILPPARIYLTAFFFKREREREREIKIPRFDVSFSEMIRRDESLAGLRKKSGGWRRVWD